MIKTFNEITDYKELAQGLSDLIKPKVKQEYKAFCNSFSCSPEGTDYKLGFAKEVSRSATFCPDCGSALFWSREDIYKKYMF